MFCRAVYPVQIEHGHRNRVDRASHHYVLREGQPDIMLSTCRGKA
ncbi:MAG: hypothetical protein ACLR4Z_06220 [Butyricicoccaceae bacterium]